MPGIKRLSSRSVSLTWIAGQLTCEAAAARQPRGVVRRWAPALGYYWLNTRAYSTPAGIDVYIFGPGEKIDFNHNAASVHTWTRPLLEALNLLSRPRVLLV